MKNLFFAPISSFYRNNLYNELSKKFKFSVIYINKKQDKFRSKDFVDNKSKYKRINYFEMRIEYWRQYDGHGWEENYGW